MTGPVYRWGRRERAPLDAFSLHAAELVGVAPDDFRAGVALLRRAPWHILAAWEREELSTPEAYAALMRWEGGRK